MTIKLILPVVAAALALHSGVAFGQEADAGNRRGGNRGGNPEEFRQRMNDRLKTSLKASDEEWSVIQPLLEKVTAKQREASGNRFGGGRGGPGAPGGRGGAGGGGSQADRPQSASSAASQALRTTLENESASPEEIKAKLTAVRDARKKSAAELTQAREELSKVLSVRQEATLVSMGILE